MRILFAWLATALRLVLVSALSCEICASVATGFLRLMRKTLRLVVKEPVMANQFVSFVRLSLSVRERWLQNSVSGGLPMDSTARNSALLYSESVAFANGGVG